MRLATYALALVVVLVAALEVGYRLRPAGDPAAATPAADHGASDGAGEHGSGPTHDADAEPTHDANPAEQGGLPGLASSTDGYQLTLLTPRPESGPATELRLVITGPDQHPLTAYDTAHGKQLHLIVVRRDLATFQHVHPSLDESTGVWTTTIDTSGAGSYRAYADFTPTGHDGLTLGADLAVAGDFEPAAPATKDSRVADVDGYRVELTGHAAPGRLSTLTARVTRDGRPVTDLDPYLEAYGHLVALRQSDLAYLHVHPDGHPGDGSTPAGPTIEFAVDVPTAGTYRLFLDFSHDGVVRTAPFVLAVQP